jgi:hypothetical protein
MRGSLSPRFQKSQSPRREVQPRVRFAKHTPQYPT